MGLFVNPDNSAFQVALNSEIYIDKTGLLKYTNKVMDTRQALICNSRPRRFGKTTTADMLTAYYSRGCHSETMFDGKEISKWDSFKTHLNRYDLIRLDVQWFLSPSRSADTVVSHMEQCVLKELKEYYPEVSEPSLSETLAAVKQTTGNKFIIIIDEWDALIRDEAENLTVQEEYIGFLRSLFKGSHPDAGAASPRLSSCMRCLSYLLPCPLRSFLTSRSVICVAVYFCSLRSWSVISGSFRSGVLLPSL